MGQITAEIVADSLSPQGDRLTSLLITFPRIILSELLTHRMLSKNTSSSRAIPFKKMVESVQNDPFIPIAWQKAHSGMQGSEYWTEEDEVRIDIGNEFEYIEDIQPITEEFKIRWLEARDKAVNIAIGMNDLGLTKQLCNRLLEPFMWTTMLITGPRSGWDNFFSLRCPQYEINNIPTIDKNGNKTDKELSILSKSKREVLKTINELHVNSPSVYLGRWNRLNQMSDLEWLQINKGQAEIHIMDLAEKIYDAMNESTPKQLQAGEWHIPFNEQIDYFKLGEASAQHYIDNPTEIVDVSKWVVKVSTAMAARTSYTVVGEEKGIDYKKMIDLHDRLIGQNPPHSSPLEHCAKAMSSEEYYLFNRGEASIDTWSKSPDELSFTNAERGWCRNFKGFIPYRHLIENK